MDLGLLFGILGTWLLILWALLSGGNLGWFIDPTSIILVIGASSTAVFMCFPARLVKKFFAIVKRALFHQSRSLEDVIAMMVSFAEVARRDGILSLENKLAEVDDKFVVQGIQMAVDGTDPELIEQVLTNDLDNLIERHEAGKGLLDALGKYAPAFGMIGTLVGLVIMLQNMEDPSMIGPGMAVALLTTMYGAIIANAIALPLADRLARRSSEEVLYRTVIIKGVMAIQSGDNPRIVEQKLRTFLPPSARQVNEEAA